MCLKDIWNLRWAKDDTIIVRGLLAGQDILERDYEIFGPGYNVLPNLKHYSVEEQERKI